MHTRSGRKDFVLATARVVWAPASSCPSAYSLTCAPGSSTSPSTTAIDRLRSTTFLRSRRRRLVGLDRPPEPERIASDATDPALILSTSGTTGAPKGVLHTHGSLLAGIGALTRLWDWSNADHQVLALPLFHVHGLGIGLLGALLHGVSTELIPQFSPSAVCEAMARGGTLFMGVPTMYVTLLEHFDAAPGSARAFRHARLCCAGSASLSEAILHRFEAHTGQRILERYGMSETLITISNPLRGERRAGAIGHALPGVEPHHRWRRRGRAVGARRDDDARLLA